jgi:hypothetical protein
MTDSYFDRFERQLVAAERQLVPRSRRWSRRLLRRGALVSLAIAVTGVPALAATRPWDVLSGWPGTQKLQAKADVPAAAAEHPDPAPAVGVMTYRSRGGLVCLAAGPVENGRVGRYGPDGAFRAFDASEAPGPCGDIRQNLDEFGGIALAHSSGSRERANVPQGILYGLVADRSTRARVTWADGRTEIAPVSPVASPKELQGAEGTFVLAPAPGERLGGAQLELVAPSETVLHTFEF